MTISFAKDYIFTKYSFFCASHLEVSGSHQESATISHAKHFPKEMVAKMPYLADFRCAKYLESFLHGGLSDGNR